MPKRLSALVLSAIVLVLVVSPVTMLAQQPLEPDAPAGDISLASELPAAAAEAGLSPEDWASIERQIEEHKAQPYEGSEGRFGTSCRLAQLKPSEVMKRTASDGAAEDYFGYAVALWCDTLVVGAYGDDIGANGDQGSAYVFERNKDGPDNWGQVVKLTASDGAAEDYFGYAVALSCDTLVVGAYGDDIGANSDQGSAYVFERNEDGADQWGKVIKLTASDGEAHDYFGYAVALSCDTLVVGAYGDDIGANNDQGSAYVFERNENGADQWGEVVKLTASDGTGSDRFASAVGISCDTIVLGACSHDIGSNINQGSAYVFERNEGGADTWGEAAKLTGSDGAERDLFGYAVSISNDAIVVGANCDDIGSNSNQGSAYVFERNEGGADTWGQVTKVTASDGASDDCFGDAVSMSCDTIVVGLGTGLGSAYVFERNEGGADAWGQVTRLMASDGGAYDYFGHAVAISCGTIVVGAYLDDVGGNSDEGSAYVFAPAGKCWAETTKQTGSVLARDARFGHAVAISGDTLVVGAILDYIGGASEQGSAFVFERNQNGADNWGQVAKLTASDGEAYDYFGMSVAISGDTIVVGAVQDTVGSNYHQGSAYVFERNQNGADQWGEVVKLTASDGAAWDEFGWAAAVCGDTIVVGADGDEVGTNEHQGSAYVFERNQNGADQWGEVVKLTASDGAADDGFGSRVAISCDTIVVGAAYDEIDGNAGQGSAYVF